MATSTSEVNNTSPTWNERCRRNLRNVSVSGERWANGAASAIDGAAAVCVVALMELGWFSQSPRGNWSLHADTRVEIGIRQIDENVDGRKD